MNLTGIQPYELRLALEAFFEDARSMPVDIAMKRNKLVIVLERDDEDAHGWRPEHIDSLMEAVYETIANDRSILIDPVNDDDHYHGEAVGLADLKNVLDNWTELLEE